MVVNIIAGICIIIMVLAGIYALVFLEGPDRSKSTDAETKDNIQQSEKAVEQKIAQNQNTGKKRKRKRR